MTVEARMEAELFEAEQKAWAALAGYKFQMFGYWAAVWVHVNRLGGFKKSNPFKDAVHLAREKEAAPASPKQDAAKEDRNG